QLLEKDDVVEQGQLGVRPPQLGHLFPALRLPAGRAVDDRRHAVQRELLGEELLGSDPKHVLFGGKREVHQRLLGRPSTRSATMLRRISDVPASMVLPRLRSWRYCQYPSHTPPSPSSIPDSP